MKNSNHFRITGDFTDTRLELIPGKSGDIDIGVYSPGMALFS